MKFSNKKAIGLLAAALFATNCFAQDQPPHTGQTTVNLFGIDFEQSPSLSRAQYLETDLDGADIRLTIIRLKNNEEAKMFMDDRLAQFRSVFYPKRVDYPGQYSKSIECSESFKPTFQTVNIPGGNFAYFDGYANQNKVAGACSKDLIKYRFMYGVAICAAPPRIVEIEEYVDINKLNGNSLLEKITCDF